MYFDILMGNGHFLWVETKTPKKEPLELLGLIEKIVKENIPWDNPPADMITRPQELAYLKQKAAIIKDNYLSGLKDNGFWFYIFSGELTHKTEIEEACKRIENLNLPLSIIPEELVSAHVSPYLSLRNMFNLAQVNKKTYILMQDAIQQRVKNHYGLKISSLTYERTIQHLASLHQGMKILAGPAHTEIRIDPFIDIDRSIVFPPRIYFESSFHMLSALLASVNAPPGETEDLKQKAVANLKEAFLVAAKKGEVAVVKLLLCCGLPPDSKNALNETALLSTMPNIEIIQALLDKGADANQIKDGETPLWKFLGDAKITELLCQQKADVGYLKNGKTALHEAAEKSWCESAAILLKYGADPNKNDAKLNKPLHAAHVNPLLVRILLEGGADPNLPNSQKSYPLCQFMQYPPVLALLCQHGANIQLCHALHLAVKEDLKDSLIALLHSKTPEERALEVNRVDSIGLPPLFYAKSAEMIKLLHLYHADINYQTKTLQRTALHIAIEKDQHDIVLALLECCTDLSLKDYFGKTPADYCKSDKIKEMLDLYRFV